MDITGISALVTGGASGSGSPPPSRAASPWPPESWSPPCAPPRCSRSRPRALTCSVRAGSYWDWGPAGSRRSSRPAECGSSSVWRSWRRASKRSGFSGAVRRPVSRAGTRRSRTSRSPRGRFAEWSRSSSATGCRPPRSALADGYFPHTPDLERLEKLFATARRSAEEAGRDPEQLQLIAGGARTPADLEQMMAIGVTHVIASPRVQDPEALEEALVSYQETVVAPVLGSPRPSCRSSQAPVELGRPCPESCPLPLSMRQYQPVCM